MEEKVIQDGRVYARETTALGFVTRKVDPVLLHGHADAPMVVGIGEPLAIGLRLVDFDGETRPESRDLEFLVDVGGARQAVVFPMVDGLVTIEMELGAYGRVRVTLGDVADVAMAPILLEAL